MKFRIARMAVGAGLFGISLSAQTAAQIDFARDVSPIFRQNCITCHGPTQQLSGLRLDRKSSVMKSGIRRVVPGSSANSFLYHRLTESEYGMQMPPTGALRAEQINTIKTWIDQGADWPDSLANEADLPPVNPKAVALIEKSRAGGLRSFMQSVGDEPELLNARGPEGSTPFMYAVLYAPAATLERLLKRRADPNAVNDAKATALMWAVTDLEKTRVLLDHRADVNARSEDLRTPLMIAAGRSGAAPIVKLLLDRGANPNPNANPASESSPLLEAATAGDAATMELLIAHGADIKDAAQPLLTLAITSECSKCVDLLVSKKLDRAVYTGTLADIAVLGDGKAVRLMLDHGADVNVTDMTGRTPLIYAAASDLLPLDVVKLLIEHGADVNAVNRHKKAGDTGLTVLDIAKRYGDTPIVELLLKSGAKGTTPAQQALKPRGQNTIQSAIQGSIPLLQRADAGFSPKAGCVSCHNNSLAAMTVSSVRKKGFPVDEKIAEQQVQANIALLVQLRDRLHQGFVVPVGDSFGPDILGYILVGLHGEGYPPDLNTDTAAMYIRMHQNTAGYWASPTADTRPPLGSQYIGQTVVSMRALQLYSPQADKAGYEKSVRLAAAWLEKVSARTNQDRAWRLLGMAWAGAGKDSLQKGIREVLAFQKPDGGWGDVPSMDSNAYATGRALVSLQHAGLPVTDAAYKRGIQFLLSTQQEDGSWYVKTRALAFQPYFDAGFPYGFDQWISAAGTSWATMALTLASPARSAAASGLR